MAAVARLLRNVVHGNRNHRKPKGKRIAKGKNKVVAKSRPEIIQAIRQNEECLRHARGLAAIELERRAEFVQEILHRINTELSKVGIITSVRKREALKAARPVVS
jgi:hypothetical protein